MMTHSMDTDLDTSQMLLRLGVAMVLGALVGLEREARRKPAGMRTYAMVALGAAVFTVITCQIVQDAGGLAKVEFDPMRLIGGLIGGIGFLGAGSIIQARGDVRGLTTAAGIWVVGAIGLACGVGYWFIAAVATAFALVVLEVMHYAERAFVDALEDRRDDSGDDE